MVSKEEYMKYVDDLLNNDENKKNIRYLSSGYKAITKLIYTLTIISVVITLLSLLLLLKKEGILIFFVLLTISVCLISFGAIRQSNSKQALTYYRNFREKLMEYLLKGYRYRFQNLGWMSSWDFEHSQFGRKNDVIFDSKDCLGIDIPEEDGSKSLTMLSIGDVSAYNIYTDSDGSRARQDVYKGMFGYVEFPRKFKCILIINSKFERKGLKLEKVLLEDIDFNENFNIKTNNQIEARYILTPNMMEKLKYLQSKIYNIKIAFIDKYLYIGAENLNMFELGDLDINNPSCIFENLYDEIDIILKIVEEIKSNNKVFITKRKPRKTNKNKNVKE